VKNTVGLRIRLDQWFPSVSQVLGGAC